MNIYFSRSSSDISVMDTVDTKVTNLTDYCMYAIVCIKDGVVTDFEDCKIKVKEGDVLYIRDYKICKSNKLDKFIKIANEKNKIRNKSEQDCDTCMSEAKSAN